MKISQRLILGFLVIVVLVGVVGYACLCQFGRQARYEGDREKIES